MKVSRRVSGTGEWSLTDRWYDGNRCDRRLLAKEEWRRRSRLRFRKPGNRAAIAFSLMVSSAQSIWNTDQ